MIRLLKLAAHAHDRMKERTDLHPGHVDLIQRAVDTLGLGPGTYHLPLRAQAGHVIGYAQFKSVPNRKTPVLATVLGPEMTPGGTDIERMIKLNALVEQKLLRSPTPPVPYRIEQAFRGSTQPVDTTTKF